jgi:hypothetical protein
MNPKSGRRRNAPWLLLGAAWLVALVLGMFGFGHYAALHNQAHTFWDNFYLTLQLITLNSGGLDQPIPLELDLARFLLPGLTLAAAANALLGIFRQQVDMSRMRSLKNHIIICGLSHKGYLLATSFRAQGDSVVVIEQNEDNDWIESCRIQGILLLFGDASDPVLLDLAGVKTARGLFAVCDEDGINAEIALHARDLIDKRKGPPLICLAHIATPSLHALMLERESMLESSPFRLELFNVFERGARRLLQTYPAWNPETLPTSATPHILLVGLGRLGEYLILHAARDWWAQHARGRLRITIVDRRAATKVESLDIRFPQLKKACELIPLTMDVHSPEFERADFLFDGTGKAAVNAIYVLMDDDSLDLHAGLTLHHRLPQASAVPIVMRMAGQMGLSRLLRERQNHSGSTYRNLFAFALLDSTCTPELLHTTQRDLLARAVHEDYIAQHRKNGAFDESLPGLQPWDRLIEAYRQPNYRFADHIKTLLESVGYSITRLVDWDAPYQQLGSADVEAMSRLEHKLWLEDKTVEGWRFAPGSKDANAKTNPDMVPWEKLSPAEKEKNRQEILGIPSFLGRAGYQIKKESVPQA